MLCANGHATGDTPSSNGNVPECQQPLLSDTGDQICLNNRLPKELILKIFSYLDITMLARCSQVCKYWYEIAFDGSNWKNINLFCFQKDVQPQVIEKIAQRSRGFLRHLKLTGCRYINDDAIRQFSETCRLIEEIELSGCINLSDEACCHLGAYSRHLSILKLWSCPKIGDRGMRALSACSHLICLDISWCNVSDQGLSSLAEGCHQLRRLRCMGCRKISSRGIEALSKQCPNLTLLNLSYCGQEVTDDALIHLSRGCPELQVLCVSYCSISDRGLHALARGCQKLTSIEVAHCEQITDSGISALSRAASGLENLDLEDCSLLTDSTLNCLSLYCEHLHSLVVSHCDLLTDAGIQRLSSGQAGHDTLVSLAMDNCPMVTDQALEYLAENCHQLQRLDIYDCQHISRLGISKLENARDKITIHTYFAPASTAGSIPEPRTCSCPCCTII